ncbi:diguanylate cyclase [Neorhizobium sp. LMR1-1-1.1]
MSIVSIHGHQAGDAVIREVSVRLMAKTGPLDMIARLEGEDFAAILASVSTEQDLETFSALPGAYG